MAHNYDYTNCLNLRRACVPQPSKRNYWDYRKIGPQGPIRLYILCDAAFLPRFLDISSVDSRPWTEVAVGRTPALALPGRFRPCAPSPTAPSVIASGLGCSLFPFTAATARRAGIGWCLPPGRGHAGEAGMLPPSPSAPSTFASARHGASRHSATTNPWPDSAGTAKPSATALNCPPLFMPWRLPAPGLVLPPPVPAGSIYMESKP